MERVATGIGGLDEMIEGGFKRNNTIVLIGGCGSGKSTMAMQYLYNGANSGEPGVYITFEEEAEQICENMLRFGWDLKKLEEENKLKIMRIEPQDVMHILRGEYGAIVDTINQLKARRVVIDSLTSVEMMIESDFEKRQGVLKLMAWLRQSRCTSVLIAESEQDPHQHTGYGPMESISDGVIILYNLRRGKSRIRALEILKMRGTNHMAKLVPYKIENGITLQPTQTIFGDVAGGKD